MTLVTLTTDFGTRDPYVAQMKGVLFREGPSDMRVVDLSHELPPFDIHEAALFVRAALPTFPAGSVHLVVVDPGVGSARRPMVARIGTQFVVGPDNGVFGHLYDGSEEVHALSPERVGAARLSSTFHGRDLFAPAAGRLAHGMAPSELGERLACYERMVLPRVELRGDALLGCIIHADRYGNLITNVTDSALCAFLGDGDPARLCVTVAERPIFGLLDHYAAAEPGALLVLIGSSGLLEVAAREASARGRLGAEVGAPVCVRRG